MVDAVYTPFYEAEVSFDRIRRDMTPVLVARVFLPRVVHKIVTRKMEMGDDAVEQQMAMARVCTGGNVYKRPLIASMPCSRAEPATAWRAHPAGKKPLLLGHTRLCWSP
jgi:hypothetical protein